MPAERCPRCGTPRTAGSCGCHAVSPVEETAVLPHLEGPPLVRPYVAGASVVEPGDPALDPFATRSAPPPVQPIAASPQGLPQPPAAGPPVAVPTTAARPPAVQPITAPPAAPATPPPPPPPDRAPHVPQAASPFGPPQPEPDAAATQLLPPVPQQQQSTPQQSTPQQTPPQGAPGRFVPIPPPGPARGPGQVPAAEQTMPLTLGPVVAPPPPSPVSAAYPPVAPAPAGPEALEATRVLKLDGHGPRHDSGDAHGEEASPRQAAAPTADLGMFTFREDGAEGPVSRADRRERRRQSADRRRLVIAGGAVGVTALGASLAMLLSSSPAKVDNALPAPTGPAVSSPAEVSPSPTAPAPATETSAPAQPTGSASPTRTTARPTQAVTSKAAAAPTGEAPPAPSTPAAPSTTAQPSASGKVLKFGDTGPEVTQMQQALMAYRCDRIGPLTIDRTRSGQQGFGDWTRQVLSGVQHDLFGDAKPRPYQDGVYDAATQAALAQTPRGASC
ncbi:hypothetical protein [Kitasatospora phosalacinea]|uniref:hypothetical protein n=1 Tax=Kitasatospora phosalacinea TaxID=2065 RepID=UPI0005274E2D|nr:hypothetical protein [Kitasatospora phosalacinea]